MIGAGDADVAATIDVGSNSVLLLVVEVGPDGTARAVDEAVQATRLGSGLAPGGTLDADAVARTTAAVAAFAARARVAGAGDLFAFATGAARRAADGRAFAARLVTASGCSVEILSGEREARLAHAAVVHGLGLDADVLAVDVGGMTTELTLGRGGVIGASASLPLGALALTECCGADLAQVRDRVARALATTDVPARAAQAGATLVGSGGTATALAARSLGLERYVPRLVHGTRLSAAEVGWPDAMSRSTPGGIDAERATILPAGACILAGVMRAMGAGVVRVSDHGVRHGYLRECLLANGREVSMRALWG